jgi:nickel/cobalt transporter (NicO) family protein
MSAQFSSLAFGILSVSLLHSLVPHHWLPFVVIGRKQKWPARKTLSVLSLGATVHMISTIAVGLIVGFLGHQIDQRFEALHGIIPGLILMAFGSGFLLSSFGHRHHHDELSDKVAASTLITMLGLSPCVVVAPFFLVLGPLGIATVLKISVAMAVLNIAGMTFFGWLAHKGLNAFKLDWLEEHESRVVGVVLMLLGISFIIL